MEETKIERAAEALLKEYFTYPGFKTDAQKKCITELMFGRDVLALLPTSAGKSLCYQIPALYFEGLTIVVTPLQALMHDQVERLNPCEKRPGEMHLKKRIPAAYIDSTQKERDQILIDAVKGKYKLLYVSPERLQDPVFIRFSQKVSIDFIAVDEAHCISMWGYDYRPMYLEILRFIRQLPRRPVLGAFTATAAQIVKEDVIRILKLDLGDEGARRGLVEGGFARSNLSFSVQKYKSENGKKKAVLKVLAGYREDAGLIYCSTVDEVKKLHEYLQKNGFEASIYYGEYESEKREESRRRFMEGESRLMVATNAFGMGIDKADIRFVIHYNMPKDLESYYQEAGRAGRDGEPADCILLYDPDDRRICESFLRDLRKESSLCEEIAKHRYQLGRYRLDQMEQYCMKDGCRSEFLQAFMEAYFTAPVSEKLFTSEYARMEMEYIQRQVREIPMLYSNNTRIANELRKGAYQPGEAKQIECGSRRAKENDRRIPVVYTVKGEAHEKLSYFDLMVADAVYTLELYRVPVLYPKNIYELLSGDSSVTLKPDKKAMIEQSLEKMRRMTIAIDCRGAAYIRRKIYEEEAQVWVYSGSFLPLERRGEKGYVYTEMPPLAQFATAFHLKGQFLKFPMHRIKVLDEEGRKLPSSEENLKIIHYLLYRLAMMVENNGRKRGKKGKRVLSRIILYDTLFEVTGLKNEWPKEKYQRERKQKTLIHKVHQICDYYKRIHMICDYELCEDVDHSTSRKKVYKGIRISFPLPENPSIQ